MATSFINTLFFDLGDTLVISSSGWIAGAKDTIAALKDKGIRLGIISNTGDLSRAQVLALLPNDFKLSDFTNDLVLFSSEVGHAKPAKEIFELAVAKADVAASSCLYCSENLVETLAAQQVGMRAARVMTSTNDMNGFVSRLKDAGLIP